MGLWDKLKEGALEVAGALRDRPLQVPLTQGVLNRAIARALPAGGDIESLEVAIDEGWLEVQVRVTTRLGPVWIAAGFELHRVEIGPAVQRVELSPRGHAQARAERWPGRVGLGVLQAVLVLRRQTLLEWALRRRDGVSLREGLVVIELAQLGLQELLLTAARSQAGEYGALAEALLRSRTQTVLASGAVTGARCVEERLLVEFRMAAGAGGGM